MYKSEQDVRVRYQIIGDGGYNRTGWIPKEKVIVPTLIIQGSWFTEEGLNDQMEMIREEFLIIKLKNTDYDY